MTYPASRSVFVPVLLGWAILAGELSTKGQAATVVWSGAGTGRSANTWSDGTNWHGVAPSNSAVADVAAFVTLPSGSHTPHVDSSMAIAGITFAGTTAYTISGSTSGMVLTVGDRGITNDSTATQTLSATKLSLALGADASFISNTGTLTIANAVNNAGHFLTLGGSATTGQITGIISGSGGVTKSGNGTWKLSGANTYTGATTINAGILSVGTIGNAGVAGNLGKATAAASNLVLGGGTLRYTGSSSSTDRNFTLTAGTSSTIEITAASKTLTIAGAAAPTSGALVKSGPGQLALAGANQYTGGTTVSAGTLTVSGSLAPNGAVTVNTGGTLNLNYAAKTIGSLSGTGGTINFGSTGTLTINQVSNYSFAGRLSGSGAALAKSGGGTLTLSGANDYTGPTSVTAGTLALANTAALPSATAVLISGGTLALGHTGTYATSGKLTVGGVGSTIDFGAGVGATTLSFGNSSSVSWNSSVLTILNYDASAGDKLRFGTNSGGLNPTQLGLLSFTGYSGTPTLDANGYVTGLSAVPEPATYAAIFGATALAAAWYHRRRKARRSRGAENDREEQGSAIASVEGS
jgi:fibronectin-binding autotransporter adhesin